MSKKRLVNNGRYIRNANLIGNGPKASPVDGSFVKGIETQRAKEKLLKNAADAKNHSEDRSVKHVRKLTP